jgi:ribosomal-protein-alanine N-acetyltransferase
MQIKEFFWKQTFRITFSKNIHMNNFLLKHWYYWKDNGHIMLQTKKIDTFSFDLPDNVVMSPVNNLITLQHYKEIFSTAFQKTLEQTEQKFWFYDTILINPEDSHINAFVLYEDGKPVAIGAYYAFDTFSVENIGTLPEARGKGYAQIIVKKLLQEAKKLWYTQAALVASEMGAPVYTKLGFTTLHETTTFISPTSEEKNIAS